MSGDPGPSDGKVTTTPWSFQNMIFANKAERRSKAELKRDHDYRRIKDMKSRDGVHPLDIFPKEIWAHIFSKLKYHPKDLWSVYQIHPLFRSLLEKYRVRDILFPQVISLNGFLVWKSFEGRCDCDYCNENLRSRSLNYFAQFTSLRRVSKSLRHAFDLWHEKDLVKMVHERHYHAPDIVACPEESPEALKRLIKNFSDVESPNAKNFFLRAFQIKMTELGEESFEDDSDRFENLITSLLETIGDQIWSFTFRAGYFILERALIQLSLTRFYQRLRNWVAYMPNLKYLRIDIGPNAFGTIRSFPPFPHMENLERITLKFQCGTEYHPEMARILIEVLRPNAHVKVLEILPGQQNGISTFYDCLAPLIHSNPLDLDVFFWEGKTTSFEMIQNMVNFQWKLKHLRLAFDLKKTTMATVFHFLNRFPSLERLSLQILMVDLDIGDNLPFLNLHELTHFEMNLELGWKFISPIPKEDTETYFLFSLQFLVAARKLRKLVWRNSYAFIFTPLTPGPHLYRYMIKNENKEESVDFRAGLRDMRASNIWDAFPELESIKVKIQKVWQDPLLPFTLSFRPYYLVREYWKKHLILDLEKH